MSNALETLKAVRQKAVAAQQAKTRAEIKREQAVEAAEKARAELTALDTNEYDARALADDLEAKARKIIAKAQAEIEATGL